MLFDPPRILHQLLKECPLLRSLRHCIGPHPPLKYPRRIAIIIHLPFFFFFFFFFLLNECKSKTCSSSSSSHS